MLVFFGPLAGSEKIGRALAWLTERWVRYAKADENQCSENAQDLRSVTIGWDAGDYVSKFRRRLGNPEYPAERIIKGAVRNVALSPRNASKLLP